MKLIVGYLLLILLGVSLISYAIVGQNIVVLEEFRIPILSALSGSFGGIVYCLRSVYLNASVKKNWDKDWHVWYLVRPIVSALAGGASFIFLKAGLLVLDTSEGSSSIYGFLALAFIAGLNVDKFIAKLEDVAQSTFGIEKSRAAKSSERNNKSK